jgi:putative restriction endonuclease
MTDSHILITITPEYQIEISSLLKKPKTKGNQEYFLKYDGQSIILPSRFLPDPELLEYHSKKRFNP